MMSNELQTFAGELRTSDASARRDIDLVFTSSSTNKLVIDLVRTGEPSEA